MNSPGLEPGVNIIGRLPVQLNSSIYRKSHSWTGRYKTLIKNNLTINFSRRDAFGITYPVRWHSHAFGITFNNFPQGNSPWTGRWQTSIRTEKPETVPKVV
jgi:hypothetical protein